MLNFTLAHTHFDQQDAPRDGNVNAKDGRDAHIGRCEPKPYDVDNQK